ncbi:MAG: TolC family protein [Chthoniobacteraceae bacterium]
MSFGFLATGCAVYHSKPLDHAAVDRALRPPPLPELRVEAAKISHPLLSPVRLDPARGLDGDQAALLAVLMNPALRADRDRRGLAVAQLVQAGILPNPQVSFTRDFVTGGNTAGTLNAFGFGATWDLTALITLPSNLSAARANLRSIDLDIAWNEWVAAQAARTALYHLVGLNSELAAAEDAARALRESSDNLRQAEAAGNATILDLSAAEASRQDAEATVLGLRQERDQQRLALNKALGLPPGEQVRLAKPLELPARVKVPSEQELNAGLEDRRLDLLALRQGYESEQAKVRAAILAQFPRIGLGFQRANDTSNVHTTGFGITLDVPLFDRNQGAIATEEATRQSLFDEFTNRVFTARSDIASALVDVRSLNEQIAATQLDVASLQRLVEVSQAALKQGNTDVISAYQSRNNLLQKRIQLTKLKLQLSDAWIALEIAAGRYLALPSH